ncbi:hypothetical protein BGZ60DRAFT_565533 [Tricladium varicosporioides]|nr:hypothetical protein BGZ60DRAFT_565533 [Hymenoscyphus varicosporioides]
MRGGSAPKIRQGGLANSLEWSTSTSLCNWLWPHTFSLLCFTPPQANNIHHVCATFSPNITGSRSALCFSYQSTDYAPLFYSVTCHLLYSIYRPASANLKKGSPEYAGLARSGRAWENFFKPENIDPYLQAQSDLKQTLTSIDELKEWYQEHDEAKTTILRALNPLHIGDSAVIFDKLEKQVFYNIDSLDTISTSEISKLALPTPEELLPGKNSKQVSELRNHIFVSRYITEVALNNGGTAGMSVADIKQLSAMILRGTDAEVLYAFNWGKKMQIGEYRSVPISVRSNPMHIFLYP